MTRLPLVLAALLVCPVSGVAQTVAPHIDARSVRLTVAGHLSVEQIISLVDPSLPTTGWRWRALTVVVRSPDGATTEVPRPGKRVSGAVVSSNDRSITIRPAPNAGPVVVPWAAIATIERPVGTSRWRHVRIGLLAGAAGGALFGLVAESGCEGFCLGPVVALPLAGIGAGIGALVGALLRPDDRWAPVARQNALEPSVSPTVLSPTGPVSVTISTGGALTGGPAHDLEQAWRAAGYGGTSSGCFFSCPREPVQYPRSHRGLFEVGHPLRVDAMYRMRPAWSTGLLWRRAPIGVTTGLEERSYVYLSVGYRTRTMAVVVSRHAGPWRFSAGPAWHEASSRVDVTTRDWRRESRRLGYIAEAGLRLPSTTRIYFDTTLTYAGGPRANMGPFTPTYGVTRITVPATRVSLNHWFIGVGGGARF